jgi:transketolase
VRSLFNKTLLEIAGEDSRIFLVLADIGYGEVEEFQATFPERFFNVGVAEEAMAGVACGLALEGYIPVIYTINNFVFIRCLEFIRNDICYHQANVKIVVVGAGLHYGALGQSHHAMEHFSIMRSLGGMIVCSPCDLVEAEAATYAMIQHQGPFCYCSGRKGEPPLHRGPIQFELGKAIQIKEGNDITFMFSGTIGANVLAAVNQLEREGLHCRVVSMHTVKPIDRQSIVAAAEETGGIITVEEHTINGGFGSAVAEVLCDEGIQPKRFLRMALPDGYPKLVGSQKWLQNQFGLSTPKIVERTKNLLQ